MSLETIYKCDNHVLTSYSWERDKEESREPIKDGWLAARERDYSKGMAIEVKRITAEPHPEDKHFCSHKCLFAWIEGQLPVIEEEEQPKEVSA